MFHASTAERHRRFMNHGYFCLGILLVLQIVYPCSATDTPPLYTQGKKTQLWSPNAIKTSEESEELLQH